MAHTKGVVVVYLAYLSERIDDSFLVIVVCKSYPRITQSLSALWRMVLQPVFVAEFIAAHINTPLVVEYICQRTVLVYEVRNIIGCFAIKGNGSYKLPFMFDVDKVYAERGGGLWPVPVNRLRKISSIASLSGCSFTQFARLRQLAYHRYCNSLPSYIQHLTCLIHNFYLLNWLRLSYTNFLTKTKCN